MKNTRGRLLLVAVVPLVLLTASGAVAGYLQLHKHETFRNEAERNYARKIILDDMRGEILDRNDGLLASSVDVMSVFADPKLVKERPTRKDGTEYGRSVEEIASLLAETLELPYEHMYERVTRNGRFAYLKRRVSARAQQRLEALDLRGIGFQQELKRFYPKKEVGGQILGMVGGEYKGQTRGLEGVELAWDGQLRGETKEIRALRDTRGRTSLPEAFKGMPLFAGNTVVLTIDESIQEHVELELERAVVASRALSGLAVVMDVQTGEILAMANVPRFNPNNFREFSYERARNRAISDAFEPGSTFKVFTLAAALDVGVVTLDDVIDVENGNYRVGTHIIHDTHPHDLFSVWDVVKYSSNIGFAKLGELMGRELLDGYLRDFGFGSRPGTGLKGEARGSLPPTRDWAPITFANICFGQGVGASAVQLTRAMAAVANGGRLMRPILVKEVRDSTGTVRMRNLPRMEKQVVSEDTAALVMAALRRVVEPDGTGPEAKSLRYDVAGKTGTAQKADAIIGGYRDDAWVGSFLGTAPAEAPRIAVLVAIDEPVGKAYGGLVAGPAFREIVDWTLDYLGTPPSHATAPRRARIAPGDGVRAPIQTGAAHAAPMPRNPAGADTVLVPDFRGLSVANVRDLAAEAGVDPRVLGVGLAVEQSPLPGTQIAPYSPVEIRFAPKE